MREQSKWTLRSRFTRMLAGAALALCLGGASGCAKYSTLQFSLLSNSPQTFAKPTDSFVSGEHCRLSNSALRTFVLEVITLNYYIEDVPPLYHAVALQHALLTAPPGDNALVDGSFGYRHQTAVWRGKECLFVEGATSKLPSVTPSDPAEVGGESGTGRVCWFSDQKYFGRYSKLTLSEDEQELSQVKHRRVTCVDRPTGSHLFELWGLTNGMSRVDVSDGETTYVAVGLAKDRTIMTKLVPNEEFDGLRSRMKGELP